MAPAFAIKLYCLGLNPTICPNICLLEQSYLTFIFNQVLFYNKIIYAILADLSTTIARIKIFFAGNHQLSALHLCDLASSQLPVRATSEITGMPVSHYLGPG
jgi:hypothetical protein